MKRGISSLSFSGPLGRKIDAAARAGFAGIEIFREDLIDFDGKPADVARLARDAGIAIFSLQSLRDYEAVPEAARPWAARRAGRFLDLAAAIGAPLLVVCANTRPDTLADPARAAGDLAMLADLAAKRGLALGYEALSGSHVVRTYAEAWSIVRAADRPNLGLIVGAVHSLTMGQDFEALRSIPAERIALVHMADAPRMKIDPALLNRHFRVFPGQGDLPVAALAGVLTDIGYAGPVSLEIFNDQVRAMPAATVANDGIRAFELLADSSRPATPPARGIGFVEIACHGADAERLKTLLGALGFAPVLAHASMAVTVFRQGAIDIVVNEEENSLAHSFYLLHGLCVFALAMTVDDLPAMLARVEKCRGGAIASHGGPSGPKIPAIRGVGGSFVYLLDGSPDAYYAADFKPVGATQTPAGMSLRLLDHFSQAVAPQEHLSSVLYYRALFGFEAGEQIDLIDPHGTVQNRNLKAGDGAFWMSLNASISPNSSTQRLMSQIVGAGFQHFAFRCDDIFAVAERLDPAVILAVQDNYYDDLLLRFDLDGDTLARMRRLNILYDEDAHGRYFQLYTGEINGLFFEVVQRDGYRGFGAANAPVRMAAQARDFESVQRFVA